MALRFEARRPIHLGDILADKYRVLGVVRHEHLVRVTAAHEILGAKVFIDIFEDSHGLGARLTREARISHLIESEHVAQPLDSGVLETGDVYVVWAHLDGSDLDEWLQDNRPVSVEVAVKIVLQACHALQAAHRLGITHGELNPSNLWVTLRDGEPFVKVLGFGIPKRIAESGDRLAYVQWIAFTAPEQLLETVGSRLDERADVWALGAILYLLLAGEPPFGAGSVFETVVQVLHARLRAVGSGTPRRLEEIVARSLEKDRHRRYTSASELADELMDFLGKSVGRRGVRGAAGPKPQRPRRLKPDQDVQITVYRPPSIVPARWYRLLAFVHVGNRRRGTATGISPIAEIAQRVKSVLGAAAATYRATSQEASVALAEGGVVTLVPEVPGVEFNPPSRSFAWHEDIHEESFQLCTWEEEPDTILRGKLLAYFGAVLLAEVTLVFSVTASEEPHVLQSVPDCRSFRKIFASYSHLDAHIVSDFDAVIATLGDRYLIDVRDLRAGQNWSQGLARLIEDADIFQLFWSSNSMFSPFCRQEWEYALQQRKDIRAVYWEEPMPRAEGLPPQALGDLHFARFGAARLASGLPSPSEYPPLATGSPAKGRWSVVAIASTFVALFVFWASRPLGPVTGIGGPQSMTTLDPLVIGSSPVPVVSSPVAVVSSPPRLFQKCFLNSEGPHAHEITTKPRCVPSKGPVRVNPRLPHEIRRFRELGCDVLVAYECE